MLVTIAKEIEFDYTPPKCKKPRKEYMKCFFQINIKELTKDDVKPAFFVKTPCEHNTMVISYNGSLYKEVYVSIFSSISERKKENFNFSNSIDFLETLDEKQTYNKLKKNAEKYLIIDGIVYIKCYEPYYQCTTFGLGFNHGGTGLFISYADRKSRLLRGWRADDRQGAIDGCIKIAEGRGDTKSVESIKKKDTEIQVFDPSFIKRKYKVEF